MFQKFMAADYFKGEGMDLIGGLLRIFTGKEWIRKYKVLTGCLEPKSAN